MMANNYIKFYIVLGSIATIVTVLGFYLLKPECCSLPVVLSPLFYTVLGVAGIKIMGGSSSSRLLKFSTSFMLQSVAKLFIGLAFFLVAYLNMERAQRLSFVVFFLAMYVLYAVVDTVVMLRMFNNGNDSQPQ